MWLAAGSIMALLPGKLVRTGRRIAPLGVRATSTKTARAMTARISGRVAPHSPPASRIGSMAGLRATLHSAADGALLIGLSVAQVSAGMAFPKRFSRLHVLAAMATWGGTRSSGRAL